jgi:hypothetical protein
MSVDEAFMLKIKPLLKNRDALLEIQQSIDLEKREVKRYLDIETRKNKHPDRDRNLSILKDDLVSLVEKGNYVREKLRILKKERTTLNKAKTRALRFNDAFVAAAELLLDEELFLELEAKAGTLLSINEN